jgi:hypothetical protein
VTSTGPQPTGRWLWPVVADLLCVLALAVGGKRSHEPGDSDWVVLAIAWPYALAAVLAHALLHWRRGRTSCVWPDGVVVLAATYVLGMALRAASGRGLAPAFLVVAGAVLALTMLGWRVVAQLVRRRAALSERA